MPSAPVAARLDPEGSELPVPAPVLPVVPAAVLAAAATVVEVVVDVAVEASEEDAAVAPASPSNCVATFKSAAIIADVGGADPRVSSSDWATGPTTNRMYWANFEAFAAVSPEVGTTR
jgi:hypothetical protein